MSETTLDLRRMDPYEKKLQLKKALQEVGADDQINILVERFDANQTDYISELLDEQNFDYQPRGGQENQYWIIAKRKALH